LPAVLQEVERWTDREYATLLARGDRLSADERREAAARLARYTGLDAGEIETHELRINQSLFCKELLKSRRRSIGRYDARYEGIENLSPAESRGPSFDPSYAAVRALTPPLFTAISAATWATRAMFPTTSSAGESASGTSRARWDTRRRPTP